MHELVLWGGTGQARVLAEFARALGYEIVALADNDPELASFLPGVPLMHGMDELREWHRTHGGSLHGDLHAIVAVGGARGDERLALQRQLHAEGYRIPILVHPRAFVAGDARLGAGTQVMAMAAIGAGAVVGEACIVNTSASVDHECRLDDGVHIGPGASLAGNVTVGSGAFIGTGACVVPGIEIGAGAIVGAGAVVVAHVPAGMVAYGNPARVRRATA